jgi:HK97 family phage major capsid protein
MSKKIQDLKNKRAGLVAQQRQILDTAEKDGNRELNATENSTYANIEADLAKADKDLAREEALASAEARVQADREHREERRGGSPADVATSKNVRAQEAYKKAFVNFMTGQGAPADYANALSTGDDPKGGYLLPEEYETSIIKLLYALDPMRSLATVKSSRSLVNIPIQTSGVTFAVIKENGVYPKVNPELGKVQMRAIKMGGFILASDELVDETDVASFIAETGSQGIANLQSQLWFTGNDADEPQGIFTATKAGGIAVQGVTGGVSATPAITGDNLIDLQHKLKTVYRNRASWLMHDDYVKLIRKLKDLDGNYIWQPGLKVGAPDVLLSRPFYTSDYAPTPAVGAKGIIFGDLKSYQIRDRLNTQIKYFSELFGESGQVGWRFTYRGDGRLTDANGIVTFTHGAAA